MPADFFKNTFDSWTGTEERKEFKRTRVEEAPAGEPLVAVTVTETRKSRGWDAGGGAPPPPPLATYLTFPNYPFPPYHPLSKVSSLFS